MLRLENGETLIIDKFSIFFELQCKGYGTSTCVHCAYLRALLNNIVTT